MREDEDDDIMLSDLMNARKEHKTDELDEEHYLIHGGEGGE